MYRKENDNWGRHAGMIVFEILAINIGFILASFHRYGMWNWPYQYTEYNLIIVLTCLLDAFVSLWSRSFSQLVKRGYLYEIYATIKQISIVYGLIVVYLFTMQSSGLYSRLILGFAYMVTIVLSYIIRCIYKRTGRRVHANNKRFLIISDRWHLKEIIDTLREDPSNRFELGACVAIDGDLRGSEINGVPVVACKDDVIDYVVREWIDEIFIYTTKETEETNNMISRFIEMGITVHLNLRFQIRIHDENQFIEKIGKYPVMTSSMKSITFSEYMIKRIFDIVVSFFGCIAAGLIMLVVAPFMMIQSPGPIIFAQERIGMNGRRFKMYKIRSMVMNADELKAKYQAQNTISDGMMFKLDWDPRIIGNKELPDGTRKTGIGEFIRKTSLDEFPQFFNVLKGDMSIIGTRPPTVDEWEKYKFHHRARLAVKPGITGMWQVSGRSDISDFEEVVRLDTEYINRWSLALDVEIFFKTFAAVLKHKGAR